MNARLVHILLQEPIKESSNRLPLNATFDELMQIKESDIVAPCSRLTLILGSNNAGQP